MPGFDVSVEVKVDTAKLRAIIEQAKPKLEKVVQIAAREIERDGKRAAPVDTGATKNSIQPEFKGLSARIGPSTEYAMHLEFGTVSMPARPFMIPALESARPRFIKAIQEVVKVG